MKTLQSICWFVLFGITIYLINDNQVNKRKIATLIAERDKAISESATKFSSCYEMAKDPIIKKQFLESK